MHSCWLGVGERSCSSHGGAERASLVLQYGMPMGKASVQLF